MTLDFVNEMMRFIFYEIRLAAPIARSKQQYMRCVDGNKQSQLEYEIQLHFAKVKIKFQIARRTEEYITYTSI